MMAGYVAAMVAAGVGVAAAVTRPVTLRTEDGVTLAGTFYEAARRPAPAVIMLHMLTRTRDDWQIEGHRLADAGIHALAIDFRGHGGSGAGPVDANGEPGLSRLVLDVRAAAGYLAMRPELVQPGRIGIAGASVGANAALLYAAGDPAIRSLALLSPGIDYRSLRGDTALRKYAARPALLVAGTNDPYAMRSLKELGAIGPGIRELRTIEQGGHGTTLLTREPNLPGALVDWFLRTLL